MQTASIHQTLQKEKVNLSYFPLNVRLKWVKIKRQRKITQVNSDQNFETFSAYTHLNPPPPPLVLTPMVFWHDLKEFVKKTLLYE